MARALAARSCRQACGPHRRRELLRSGLPPTLRMRPPSLSTSLRVLSGSASRSFALRIRPIKTMFLRGRWPPDDIDRGRKDGEAPARHNCIINAAVPVGPGAPCGRGPRFTAIGVVQTRVTARPQGALPGPNGGGGICDAAALGGSAPALSPHAKAGERDKSHRIPRRDLGGPIGQFHQTFGPAEARYPA